MIQYKAICKSIHKYIEDGPLRSTTSLTSKVTSAASKAVSSSNLGCYTFFRGATLVLEVIKLMEDWRTNLFVNMLQHRMPLGWQQQRFKVLIRNCSHQETEKCSLESAIWLIREVLNSIFPRLCNVRQFFIPRQLFNQQLLEQTFESNGDMSIWGYETQRVKNSAWNLQYKTFCVFCITQKF